MLREPRFQQPKPKSESEAKARAILSLLDTPMPSGKIETQLRMLDGIKEVKVNHVSHIVKIRYDPNVLTIEEIRTFLRKPVSGPQVAGSN